MYLIAPGHSVALGSLVALNPQPSSPGVEFLRRLPSGNIKISEEGPHLWLYWNVAQHSPMYRSILDQVGVLTDLIVPVTVYARNVVWDWNRYNGYAEKPFVGRTVTWRDYFPQGIGILIKELELQED